MQHSAPYFTRTPAHYSIQVAKGGDGFTRRLDQWGPAAARRAAWGLALALVMIKVGALVALFAAQEPMQPPTHSLGVGWHP